MKTLEDVQKWLARLRRKVELKEGGLLESIDLQTEIGDVLTILRAHIAEHDKIAERVAELVERGIVQADDDPRQIEIMRLYMKPHLALVLKMIRGE